MSLASFQDAVVLFGDSLTQAWSAGSLAQRMSEFYVRRLDVVNRGFAGYNSAWGVPALEQFFGTKADRDAGKAQHVRLMTLWWGANDAVLQHRSQYVPIPAFQSNLETMVSMLTSPDSKWYSPETKLVFITPPPVVEADRHAAQLTRWREFGSQGEPPILDRDASNTRAYAEAVLDTSGRLGVPCVDLYRAIVDAAGGEEPDKLRPYFYDGLHLSSQGYEVLFTQLTDVILDNWPELDPESLSMRLPYWDDVDPVNFRASITGEGAEEVDLKDVDVGKLSDEL